MKKRAKKQTKKVPPNIAEFTIIKLKEIPLPIFFREQIKGIGITIALIIASVLLYMKDITQSAMYVLFLVYLLLIFILKVDSRIPIAAALLLLILTPFYLIKNLETYANYLATLAYFFLVIGVIKQFVEYVKERKTEYHSENE